MRINVAELLQRPVGSTTSYPLEETIEVADGGPSRLAGALQLMRIGRGILMRAGIDTSYKVVCSRCLETFDYPVRLNIEEEFFQKADVNTGGPLPVPSDNGAFLIDENQELDTDEAVRQHIVMSMPMHPICREDCPGLCPRCGQNLKEGLCACDQREEDPRWKRLREWASRNDKD
ncbi:MAG: DUF177 domain-containing protein [Chloroflexi bacterium]|nr:DUF177 domain-containing protein [Chloroflexota bacterium]